MDKYSRLNICIVWGDFYSFKYTFLSFFNKSDDYSYLYIRNLLNRSLKPVLSVGRSRILNAYGIAENYGYEKILTNNIYFDSDLVCK